MKIPAFTSNVLSNNYISILPNQARLSAVTTEMRAGSRKTQITQIERIKNLLSMRVPFYHIPAMIDYKEFIGIK